MRRLVKAARRHFRNQCQRALQSVASIKVMVMVLPLDIHLLIYVCGKFLKRNGGGDRTRTCKPLRAAIFKFENVGST